jgi:hypothetical protein
VIRSSHGTEHRRATLPRRLFIAAAAALIPALAGCEAGASAPTQLWHPPTDGTGMVVHGIDIRDMFVLGAPLNSSLTAGQSAGLFFALFNNGAPDRLLSISAPGAAKSVRLPGGTVSLAQYKEVLLTGPQPKVILTGLTRALQGGSFIRVVMNFENAGSVTLSVPVMPRAQYYSTFTPAPTPTPKQTGKGKRTAHATATADATPTPSPSPSASS